MMKMADTTRFFPKEKVKIVSGVLVMIACAFSAIWISLVDIRTTINSLTIELMNDPGRSLRLYYDTGSGYNERESVEGEVLRRDRQAATYHFPVPSDRLIIAIRLDPDEQPAQYLINKISLNYLFDSKRVYPHLTWNAGQIERLFVPLHNVKPFIIRQGHLLVETEGPDPYFGTKENLSEIWEGIRNEPHPFLLLAKIGGYFFLALLAGMFYFRRYVSVWLAKIDHLFPRMAILGLMILFAISAYFILAGGGVAIGAYYLLFYWIYLTGIFFLAGWIMQRLLNVLCQDVLRDIDLTQCVIFGVVALTITVMLLHFVLPLNDTTHLAVVLALCVVCLFNHKEFFKYCIVKLKRAGVVHRCCSTKHIFLAVIVFAGFILVELRVVYLSIGGPTESDTLLYHAQIVKWIKEYPIVPGLGNLHGRLAYNSSFHVLASFFDIGAFHDKSFHGLNGFFFLFLQATLLVRVWFLCRGDIRISNIFAAVFIFLEPFLVNDSFFVKMNSLSTDFLTFVLTGYVVLNFISFLENGVLSAKGEVIIAMAIAGFAATVKLVSVPLLLVPVFIMIRHMNVVWLKRAIEENKRFYLILCLLVFILFAPWAMRSVILSGYPVYPVHYVDIFNPDWKIPKELVVDEVRWIQSFARVPRVHPDQVLGHGFLHWFHRWHKQSVVPLGVVLGIHLLVLIWFFPSYKNILRKMWPIYATLSAALVYWFSSAPDLRFGYGIIYTSAVFLVSAILVKPLQAITAKESGAHLLKTVVLSCVMLTIFWKNPNYVSYLNEKLIDMPVMPTKEYVTKSGLKLRIPVQGDVVGNAGLPSTPYPRNNIVLRKEGLEGGFRSFPL